MGSREEGGLPVFCDKGCGRPAHTRAPRRWLLVRRRSSKAALLVPAVRAGSFRLRRGDGPLGSTSRTDVGEHMQALDGGWRTGRPLLGSRRAALTAGWRGGAAAARARPREGTSQGLLGRSSGRGGALDAARRCDVAGLHVPPSRGGGRDGRRGAGRTGGDRLRREELDRQRNATPRRTRRGASRWSQVAHAQACVAGVA